MARQFWYEMDKRGVCEILKSEAVLRQLQDIADAKTAQANNLFAMQGGKGEGYASKTKNLTFVAIGVVYPSSMAGKRDNAKNQTLNAVNH